MIIVLPYQNTSSTSDIDNWHYITPSSPLPFIDVPNSITTSPPIDTLLVHTDTPVIPDPLARISTRNKSVPAYLKDYVCHTTNSIHAFPSH